MFILLNYIACPEMKKEFQKGDLILLTIVPLLVGFSQ